MDAGVAAVQTYPLLSELRSHDTVLSRSVDQFLRFFLLRSKYRQSDLNNCLKLDMILINDRPRLASVEGGRCRSARVRCHVIPSCPHDTVHGVYNELV
jgi:hypothetical protein